MMLRVLLRVLFSRHSSTRYQVVSSSEEITTNCQGIVSSREGITNSSDGRLGGVVPIYGTMYL